MEPRNIALIGAAATALVIINMLTGIEPPSQMQCAWHWQVRTLASELIMMRQERRTLADNHKMTLVDYCGEKAVR